MNSDDDVPTWLRPYAAGDKARWAQNHMAYAAYHGVDGSADDDPELEERIAMHRAPMVGYVCGHRRITRQGATRH